MARILVRSLLSLFACVTFASATRAAWPPDPVVGGVALENLSTIAYYPASCSDGAGGAIVVWADYRNGSSLLYAQRLNAAGVPQWNAAGNLVCAVPGDKYNPVIVPDGAGGAVIAWEDLRTGAYDVYAQRLNSAGALLWTSTAVPVCTRTLEQSWLHLVADGAGSFYLSWEDESPGSVWNAYVQKLNLSGAAQWPANGLLVCANIDFRSQPRLAPDGLGGVWVAFQYGPDRLAYVQRVSSPGATVFAAPGRATGPVSSNQSGIDVIGDGYGRAIVVWTDNRAPSGYQGYAQCVNFDGSMRWNPAGVLLSDHAGWQIGQRICTDGSGGVFVAWQDMYTDAAGDIFMQRVTAAGALAWGSSGLGVCQLAGYQYPEAVASDGVGGVLVTWSDSRSGNADLYALRLAPTGQYYWSAWQGLAPDGPVLLVGVAGVAGVAVGGQPVRVRAHAHDQRLDRRVARPGRRRRRRRDRAAHRQAGGTRRAGALDRGDPRRAQRPGWQGEGDVERQLPGGRALPLRVRVPGLALGAAERGDGGARARGARAG